MLDQPIPPMSHALFQSAPVLEPTPPGRTYQLAAWPCRTNNSKLIAAAEHFLINSNHSKTVRHRSGRTRLRNCADDAPREHRARQGITCAKANCRGCSHSCSTPQLSLWQQYATNWPTLATRIILGDGRTTPPAHQSLLSGHEIAG